VQLKKVLGVVVCLTGAFLMFHGSILGEDTTGIATVLGIIGIGLISARNTFGGLERKDRGGCVDG
jgi:hypothetical protein